MKSNRDNNVPNDFFEELPPEMSVHTLSFLSQNQLSTVSSVSNKFSLFSMDNYTLRLSLAQNFGIHKVGMDPKKLYENFIAQKKELLSIYNLDEDPYAALYRFGTDGQKVTLNMAELDGIINNPTLLNNYGWRVDWSDVPGLVYPIEMACSNGLKEMVQYLIHKNSLIGIYRSSALCQAIEKNHHEIVQDLIDAGVSVTECMLYASESQNYDVKITLETANVYWCPLFYAIEANAVESAKLLIQHGASLNDLSFVHPADPDFCKDKQVTVLQSIESGRLTLSNEMKQMIEEQNLQQTKCLISQGSK